MSPSANPDVPVEVVARVMLGVLDAIQKHTNVIEVLTPDHFVVARKGDQWSKQELAGNAKIMINDRVKHVEDPRNRISKHFADGPKTPFFWLWEVLFMSPLQIVVCFRTELLVWMGFLVSKLFLCSFI